MKRYYAEISVFIEAESLEEAQRIATLADNNADRTPGVMSTTVELPDEETPDE